MTLKWGSTTVTAVKWGSTTCTAVYWGSIKVWPDSPFAVLSDPWVQHFYNYHSGEVSETTVNCKNTTSITGNYNTSATVSGKTLTANGSRMTNTTHYMYAALLTSMAYTCSGNVTLTINVTAKASSGYAYAFLAYGTSKPSVLNDATSSTNGFDKINCHGNITTNRLSLTSTGTMTKTVSLSGTYYLGACIWVLNGTTPFPSFTITNLTL